MFPHSLGEALNDFFESFDAGSAPGLSQNRFQDPKANAFGFPIEILEES